MSQLFNMPVDNGERLPVTSTFFNGSAGVRRNEQGGEFACQGEIPLRLRDRSGTVDGAAVVIVDVRKSGVASGMIVARFDYLNKGA